jgi:hypothetical protein
MGICWRCGGEDTLACLLCLEARGEPPEIALMDAVALDRLHALPAQNAPVLVIHPLPGVTVQTASQHPGSSSFLILLAK